MQKYKKLTGLILSLLIMTSFTLSCKVEDKSENEIKKKIIEIASDKELKAAVIERIRNGATIKDLLPSTGVLITAAFVPIAGVIGFFIVLGLFIGLYHKRTIAMIEKGTYEKNRIKVRWDLLFLLTGLILTLVGPAISLLVCGILGLSLWAASTGLIPMMLGIALLIFHKLYIQEIK